MTSEVTRSFVVPLHSNAITNSSFHFTRIVIGYRRKMQTLSDHFPKNQNQKKKWKKEREKLTVLGVFSWSDEMSWEDVSVEVSLLMFVQWLLENCTKFMLL